MPNSHMSSTRSSYVRTKINPSGRFFVLCPTTNIEASFLLAQNDKDEASSNGRIGFFLENDMACGRLRAIYDNDHGRKSGERTGEKYEDLRVLSWPDSQPLLFVFLVRKRPYEDPRPLLAPLPPKISWSSHSWLSYRLK